MRSSESFIHIEETKQVGEGVGEECFVASSLWDTYLVQLPLVELCLLESHGVQGGLRKAEFKSSG